MFFRLGTTTVTRAGLGHPQHARWLPAQLSRETLVMPLRVQVLAVRFSPTTWPMMRCINPSQVAAEFTTPRVAVAMARWVWVTSREARSADLWVLHVLPWGDAAGRRCVRANGASQGCHQECAGGTIPTV